MILKQVKRGAFQKLYLLLVVTEGVVARNSICSVFYEFNKFREQRNGIIIRKHCNKLV